MQPVLMFVCVAAMIVGAAGAANMRFPLSGRGVQGESRKLAGKTAPRPQPDHGMGAREAAHLAHPKGRILEKQRTFTYSGAWFHDASSVQQGENWIEDAWSSDACNGGPLLSVQFKPYTYTVWYFFSDPMFYSAKNISGSFTCG